MKEADDESDYDPTVLKHGRKEGKGVVNIMKVILVMVVVMILMARPLLVRRRRTAFKANQR